MPKISVILPTFNERDNCLALIDELGIVLIEDAYEIIVVDDCSPDQTASAIQERRYPQVTVLVPSKRLGYASSIRRGIEEAKGEWLVIMDSDFNHNPKDIPRMLEKLKSSDGVSASRFLNGGGMSPAWRGLASRVFNGLIRLKLKSRGNTSTLLTDYLFGFFAMKRACLTAYLNEEIFYGFGDYGMRLLYYLQRDGRTITEIPAICQRRKYGHGNTRLWQTLVRYICEVLKL